MSINDPTTSFEYRELPWTIGYRFRSDGTVWSCWKRVGPKVKGEGIARVMTDEWKQLHSSPAPAGRGYLRVSVKVVGEKKCRTFPIHKLMLMAFVGPCPEGLQACHGNGIRSDNRIENLRWDTAKSNAADRSIHGRAQIGERHWKARLNESDIEQIRLLRSQGKSLKELAQIFFVSLAQISRICLRQSWTCV